MCSRPAWRRPSNVLRSPACGRICTQLWGRAAEPSPPDSTTSGIWGSNGPRVRRMKTCAANTSASSQLGSRMIEDLIDLPLMTDPASLATMDVLTKIGPPAFLTDANLHALAICYAVNLSLE